VTDAVLNFGAWPVPVSHCPSTRTPRWSVDPAAGAASRSRRRSGADGSTRRATAGSTQIVIPKFDPSVNSGQIEGPQHDEREQQLRGSDGCSS